MVVFHKGIKIEFDDIVDEFDSHGPYCIEVEVHGSDGNGVEYSAIGYSDGEDVIEIHKGTIEVLD